MTTKAKKKTSTKTKSKVKSKTKSKSKAVKPYSIVSAQAMHKRHPQTFEVPSTKRLDSLKPGSLVKAAFKAKGGDKATERMWVVVTKVSGNTITGKLDNVPAFKGSGLRAGSVVTLKKSDVYDVMSKGIFGNPAKGFKKGDVVRYTAKFLRSTGQIAGAPINGLVEGDSTMTTDKGAPYPVVRWSDRDEAVTVHPGNLEYDPRWRQKSARNPYQGDAIELANWRRARQKWELAGRRGPPPAPPSEGSSSPVRVARNPKGKKRRLPFAIAYQVHAMVDTGFLGDLTGAIGGDDGGDLENVHILMADDDHLLVIGTLVTTDKNLEAGGEADDAAHGIWAQEVGITYPEIFRASDRTTIDAFEYDPKDQDAEWFPDAPPKKILSPYLKDIRKLLSVVQGSTENPKTRRNPYASIEEIMHANKAAGNFWFQPETLSFFNSNVYPEIYGGRYFISKERMDERFPWKWSIRVAHDNGDIDTVGELAAYDSLAAAKLVTQTLGTKQNPARNPASPRNCSTFRNAEEAWSSCGATRRNKAPLLSIDAQGHVCGRPGALSSKEREELPTWAFALPGDGKRSGRKYPLYTIDRGYVAPSKTHAVTAKGRAKDGLNRGDITDAQYKQIVKAANKVIRLCKDQKTRKNAAKKVRLTTGYLNDRRITFPDVRLEYESVFTFKSVAGYPELQVAYLDGEAVGWVSKDDIPVAKRSYPDATSRAAALLGSRSHGGKRRSKKSSEAGRLMGRVGQAEIKKKLLR